ncbi:hypothetical protein GIB67_042605 [Kingdonia uniflora]|uniref:phosphomevalonate kinase n=1 Tax=Kingdonia uniflora TaxID=39325 RepID=A0A7J7M198_9MAGN|nr:hypothetical protein GIB67_042605 [Kingdonia uniflora]
MAVVASAPGKVLMTGGYLILERPNAGIVLSTNARFFAIVKPIYEELQPDSSLWAWADVKLSSPQLSRETLYKLSLKNSTLQGMSSKDLANSFVEQAVQYSVAAAHAVINDSEKKGALNKILLQGLDITILGSNDFYSYRNEIEARGLPLMSDSLASLPSFSSITFNEEGSNVEKCKPEVAKTGLGSSAAMTTAVVAALLHYLGVVNLPSSDKCLHQEDSGDLDLVHRVSQSAHCIAQGKVGSGFDIAVKGQFLGKVVTDFLRGKWDHERTSFSLPPLMTLLLGEPGTGGSSTPSMVGAVKKWQTSNPQNSLETWKLLSEANSTLEAQLKVLSKFAKKEWEIYRCVITSCSGLRYEKWVEQATDLSRDAVVKALLGARDAILNIRFHMREMGNKAGILIEPESQTQLLDSTMKIEGVLLAGVPGAGGFDAVFAVTLGESSSKVTNMWSSLGVLSLLVREDPRGVSLETGDPRAKEITSGIASVSME